MTLISMLIALIIERLAVRSNGWQLAYIYSAIFTDVQ